MTHLPMFRVSSYTNGMRCMSLYILIGYTIRIIRNGPFMSRIQNKSISIRIWNYMKDIDDFRCHDSSHI